VVTVNVAPVARVSSLPDSKAQGTNTANSNVFGNRREAPSSGSDVPAVYARKEKPSILRIK
jgi:hypothetical protein